MWVETINTALQGAHTLWPWALPTLAIVLGAVFGSFLGCAFYRVPQGQSLWRPPSFCPSCKTPLTAQDLVPILSWLFWGKKCRHCKAPIGPMYTWIEGGSIVIALLSFWAAGPAVHAGFLYGGIMAVIFSFLIFLKHHKFAIKSVAFGLLCLGLYAVL